MTRLTAVLLLLGITVLGWLVLHIGLATLGAELQKLGINLVWVFLPSVGMYLLEALGWRTTLGRHAPKIRFDRLFLIRMAGEAINFTTPAAYLGGEPMKAYLLSRYRIPLVDGLASVVTAKTIMTLAEVLFILIGIGLGLALLNRSSDVIVAALVGLVILGFGTSLFLALQRRGLFVGLLRLLEGIGLRIEWLKTREAKLLALDEAISRFYAQDKAGFAYAFLFFFLGWAVESVEVYLILYFLGQPIDIMTAFALAALTVFVKGGTAFIPASLGGQEAGTLVLLVAFGYAEEVAIAFAIVRRLREIFWIGFGLLALTVENRRVYQADPFGRPPA
jgi:uncharacterized protein (TIRG00374 family)